jgi:hypothetical protein
MARGVAPLSGRVSIPTRRTTVLEASTRAPSPWGVGRGLSPYGGVVDDLLSIPAAPTLDFRHRYLFLVAAVSITSGRTWRLRGFWTRVRIGFVVTNNDTGAQSLWDIPVTDPDFQFPDGDILWAISEVRGQSPWEVNPGAPISTVPGARQDDFEPIPGLLYAGNADGIADPYNPAAQGQFPGQCFDEHVFHSQRIGPWHNTSQNAPLDVPIPGGTYVGLYASVAQTNPATRTVNVPITAVQPFLTQEQNLLIQCAEADPPVPLVYTRLAGGLYGDFDERREEVCGTPGPGDVPPPRLSVVPPPSESDHADRTA